ncbi:hypothetical protein ACHAXM_008176 [Skeletonema potamos]
MSGATGKSAVFFSALALLCIAKKRWNNNKGRRQQRRSAHGEHHDISQRGESLLTPTLPYIMDYLKCLQDHCDPYTNPRGHIPLCMSENKLIIELLGVRLLQIETASRAFSDSSVYCYNNTLGLPGAREALAYFLVKHFLFPERRNMTFGDALSYIHPELVCFGAGASSLISHLALCLGERGDAVLIPAPYYAAFDVDLKIIAGCIAIPVYCSADPSRGPSPRDLEEAALAAEAQGMRVRMLLITNPCNPIGTIYPPEVMKEAIKWARSRDMHTICDELYGLSTFDGPFESILRTLENELGDNVHHIWALSKDFGASGFRMGTLYTQNEKLLKSLANLNIFSGVSNPMQMMIAEIFLDDNWVYDFLHQAREKIRYSYELCTKMLDEMVIPYFPAKAGIFVYADFSSLLPEHTAEGEAKFASLLLDAARIIMTPGAAQHDQKPGMFRICYCFVSPELLTMAMHRLDNIVVKIRTRRIHWDHLTSGSMSDVIA